MTLCRRLLSCIVLALSINYVTCLKHNLVLTNDHRPIFSISSFGYLLNGFLDVKIEELVLTPDPFDETGGSDEFGFAIVKTYQPQNPFIMEPVSEKPDSHCMMITALYSHYQVILLNLDHIKKTVEVKCATESGESKGLPTLKPLPHHTVSKRSVASQWETGRRANRPSGKKCSEDIPLIIQDNEKGERKYSFNFSMRIENKDQEGFYYLTFNNCRARITDTKQIPMTVNMSVKIEEKNFPSNYLSAGVMQLPQTYFILSVMYFLCGCIWINFISRQRESALKIHTLMSVLIFAKSCSLLMHGINYHYISIYGQPVVAWAYIYYATRSVKGALFFITLALIGSGWSFVKHILSNKDKKIIMIIVGLQVIAHIAEIVLDESSEGQASNEFWAELCSLVDLFSCVAILYPIGWSVRHLEEASRTDGKAAINLKKLELFKRFYIISTIYIYVTRIVTFVLLSMLSYKHTWMAELVSELATLVYFVITGYYFQPMPTNPYLLLSSDNDLEEDILFSLDSHDVTNKELKVETTEDDGQDRKVTRRLIEDIV